MHIEILVIPDCPHAAAAKAQIETALADLCVHDATVQTTIVDTAASAVAREFPGSPTVLIDGVDPFVLSGARPAFACRVYSTPDGLSGVPDLRDLRRALKQAAASAHSQ